MGTLEYQARRDLDLAACWGNPFRLCSLRGRVSRLCDSRMTSTYRLYSWLVFKIVDIIKHRATQHDAVLATGIITNAFVIISVLSAFPWVRK